jgi:putative ABC transport system permease protein
MFTEQDRAGTLPVTIVSQSLAERFFSGVDPIGRRIRWDGHNRTTWRTIVGVVGDVRHAGHDGEIVPQNYEPFAQAPSGIVHFVVRAEVAPATMAPLLRRELREVEPELPVFRLESLERLVGGSIARQRFAMVLFSVFSGVAMILAGAGIYGVIAYAVVQRTREFGIRLALGAQAADLRRLVLFQGARLVGFGLLAGGMGAFIATRLIQALLYQTPTHDPYAFAASAALLAMIAIAACWLPAWRATKVDPMTALRAE